MLALITEASDEDAVPTTEFVFALIEETCESVLALTTAAIEEDAVVRFAAVASEPVSSVESESLRVAYDQTSAAVILPPEVSVRVPLAQTSETSVPNVVSDRVPELQTAVGMVAARDDEAVKMSACVAKEPEVNPAPVSVLVPFAQTSETSVPNEVSERVAFCQTEVAMVEEETTISPTAKLLSN